MGAILLNWTLSLFGPDDRSLYNFLDAFDALGTYLPFTDLNPLPCFYFHLLNLISPYYFY
jgi:hypothetical protein